MARGFLAAIMCRSADAVVTQSVECMSETELTQEVKRLRQQLKKMFTAGGRQLMKAPVGDRTMKKFTQILRDFDFLLGSDYKRQQRHLEDLATIYDRLDALFKDALDSKVRFMREWDEQYQQDTGFIRHQLGYASSKSNGGFQASSAWESTGFASNDEIQPQVEILRNGTDKEKRDAITTLRDLVSQNGLNRETVARKGAIELLIELLQTGTPLLKQDAACALGDFAFSSEVNSAEMVNSGGIEPLVNLLIGPEAQPECAAFALGTIAYANEANIDAIARHKDVIPRLVRLLSSSKSLQRSFSAFALGRLTTNEIACAQLVQLDAVSVLVRLLENDQPLETAYAAQTLGNLVVGNVQLGSKVMEAAQHFAQMLTGTDLQKEFAAYALCQLVTHAVFRSEISDSLEVIPQLIRLLDGSALQRQHAANALASLARVPGNCSKVVKGGGIGPLIRMLRQTEGQQYFAMIALGNIAQRNEGFEKEMVRQGAAEPLFDLLECNSKALVDCAAWVLGSIANQLGDSAHYASAAAVKILINLLTNGIDLAKEKAALVLKSVLCCKERTRYVKRAIGPLCSLTTSASKNQRTNASEVFAALSLSRLNHSAMINGGAIRSLNLLLQIGSDQQKNNAVFALANLSESFESHSKMMTVHSAVVLMLMGGNEYQRENAARALERLSRNAEHKRQILYSRHILSTLENNKETER